MTRIGSLCSGYGGLDMGLAAALGVDVAESVAWHAEYEAAPSAVLAHHWPQVPNLHDLTLVDWDDIEPVDWLTAGYPCQPFSMAGKRLGADDERHLWPYIIEGIRRIRPGRVLLENVAGHLSMGFGRVLADLAAVGYVGSWVRLPASGVGAAHRRQRVFILAADAQNVGHERAGAARGRRDGSADRGVSAADADDQRHQGLGAGGCAAELAGAAGDRPAPADTESVGRGVGHAANIWPAAGDGDAPGDSDHVATDADGDALRQQSVPERWRSCAPVAGLAGIEWGVYELAIRRWERAIGRPAPGPTELTERGTRKLSPRFDEWLMGLPDGWVSSVPGLTINEKLHILGNGVVPQQATEAVRWLIARQEANI